MSKISFAALKDGPSFPSSPSCHVFSLCVSFKSSSTRLRGEALFHLQLLRHVFKMHNFGIGLKQQNMCSPQETSFFGRLMHGHRVLLLLSCFGSVCGEWRVWVEDLLKPHILLLGGGNLLLAFDILSLVPPSISRFLITSRALSFGILQIFDPYSFSHYNSDLLTLNSLPSILILLIRDRGPFFSSKQIFYNYLPISETCRTTKASAQHTTSSMSPLFQYSPVSHPWQSFYGFGREGFRKCRRN